MGGTKIIDVKVIGICSKCRTKEDKPSTYKDGRIIPDENLYCIGCEIW